LELSNFIIDKISYLRLAPIATFMKEGIMEKNTISIVIKDLKRAYLTHDLDVGSLDCLIKNYKLLDVPKFLDQLKILGYNPYDSTNDVYQLLENDAKKLQLIRFVEQTSEGIKKNKRNVIEQISELIGFYNVQYTIIGLTLILFAILGLGLTLYFNHVNAHDSIVMAGTGSSTGTERDIDSSETGTLTLTTKTSSANITSRYPVYNVESVQLSIVTENPRIVRVKVIYDDTSVVPFEIQEFKTVGLKGSATAITSLSPKTKSVSWVN
jgi:hypothetical protein